MLLSVEAIVTSAKLAATPSVSNVLPMDVPGARDSHSDVIRVRDALVMGVGAGSIQIRLHAVTATGAVRIVHCRVGPMNASRGCVRVAADIPVNAVGAVQDLDRPGF